MSGTARRTVSLPAEQAEFIDALVARGTYASASEVVRDGLRALHERDRVMETWLADAAEVLDRMKADPESAVAAEAVFDGIRALHARETAV